MALYAIGDLHLSFLANKPMDVFGPEWKGHVKKIEHFWRKKVKENDTVVVTGDHSWGTSLSMCAPDLEFISSLPGRKILLRGNHDMFWDAKKTDRLNELYAGKLFFLQNNFYSYEDYALVGTKGYCYEGKDSPEHFLKIRDRELERLQVSFECARKALSSHQHRRRRKCLYTYGRRIRGGKGDLFSLPRQRTLSGQLPGLCKRH